MPLASRPRTYLRIALKRSLSLFVPQPNGSKGPAGGLRGLQKRQPGIHNPLKSQKTSPISNANIWSSSDHRWWCFNESLQYRLSWTWRQDRDLWERIGKISYCSTGVSCPCNAISLICGQHQAPATHINTEPAIRRCTARTYS
jgi:hypothetical protein